MAARKGTRPPAAGKGRDLGVKNKIPAALREVVAKFVENNAAQAQALFDRVAKTNPAKALELLARFAEFVLPRQREITGSLASVHVNVDAPITSADEAARVYREILGDPSFDLSAIRFESPALLPPPQEPQEPRARAIEAKPVPVPPTVAAPLPSPDIEEEPAVNNALRVWERLGK